MTGRPHEAGRRKRPLPPGPAVPEWEALCRPGVLEARIEAIRLDALGKLGVCERCGAYFETRRRAGRFCSKRCAGRRLSALGQGGPTRREGASGARVNREGIVIVHDITRDDARALARKKARPDVRGELLTLLARGGWWTTAEIALALYGYADTSELRCAWSTLGRLRRDGHQIEHYRHRGYRLVGAEETAS